VGAVRSAAAGEVVISPALLARLLPQLNRANEAVGLQLTEREIQLLGLMAEGPTNKVIAEELNLSVNTVRNYVQILLTKLNVHSKLEAVSTAVRDGIIDYPSGS
jgi:DNA-binding NarL/FixJ family response regulator